jgi:hypothetical protein
MGELITVTVTKVTIDGKEQRITEAYGNVSAIEIIGLFDTLAARYRVKLLKSVEASTPPKPGRLVRRFELGHWYRWIGGKERVFGWSSSAAMDYMLDGVARKCLMVEDGEGYSMAAAFLPTERTTWNWSPLSFFEEVDAPPSPLGDARAALAPAVGPVEDVTPAAPASDAPKDPEVVRAWT